MLTALNSCAALGQSKDVESRDQSLSVEAFRCPDAERRTAGLSKKISKFLNFCYQFLFINIRQYSFIWRHKFCKQFERITRLVQRNAIKTVTRCWKCLTVV